MFLALRFIDRKAWAAIAACIAAGLILRLAGARSGLWVDEAWSALYAREAGDAIGVFTRINHDNNHHLNSLWLQLVGLGAQPIVARGFSLATGTATVAVAALLGARRNGTCAWVSALLFASANVMVVYGSEARGYAPMCLAFLAAVLLIDKWLDRPEVDPPAGSLAIALGLGMLAHLSMILGALILALWTGIALWRRSALPTAFNTTVKAFAPSAILLLVFFNLVVFAALSSATGMRIGGSLPFTAERYWAALTAMIGTTIGLGFGPSWLFPLLAGAGIGALITWRSDLFGNRSPLYLLAILVFPAAVGILQPSNSEYVRYYMIPATALLLLVGEMIALGLRARPVFRFVSGASLVAIVVLNLVNNLDFIERQRGAPDLPVRLMAKREPAGATVLIRQERPIAVLRVAAAEQNYPLEITNRPCAAARFLFIDRNPGVQAPAEIRRCGRIFRPIASQEARSLSGVDWTLYEHRL